MVKDKQHRWIPLKRNIQNRKGQTSAAGIWLGALALLFMVGVLYLVMNQPFDMIYDIVENNTAGTIGENTVPKIAAYWRAWPIYSMIGIIVGAYILTLRNRDDMGGY